MAGALEHADSHQRSGEVALAVGTIGFGCAQPLGNPERLPEGGACLFALPEGAIHVQVSALRLTRNSRPGTSIASRSCGQMYGRAGSICCVLGSAYSRRRHWLTASRSASRRITLRARPARTEDEPEPRFEAFSLCARPKGLWFWLSFSGARQKSPCVHPCSGTVFARFHERCPLAWSVDCFDTSKQNAKDVHPSGVVSWDSS